MSVGRPCPAHAPGGRLPSLFPRQFWGPGALLSNQPWLLSQVRHGTKPSTGWWHPPWEETGRPLLCPQAVGSQCALVRKGPVPSPKEPALGAGAWASPLTLSLSHYLPFYSRSHTYVTAGDPHQRCSSFLLEERGVFLFLIKNYPAIVCHPHPAGPFWGDPLPYTNHFIPQTPPC